MTTTGDLFVNIKGDNKGLKRTLDQSSRQVQGFAKKTEDRMKNGLGFGDIAALGALMNLRSLPSIGRNALQGMRGIRDARNTRLTEAHLMSSKERRKLGFEGRNFLREQDPALNAAHLAIRDQKRRTNRQLAPLNGVRNGLRMVMTGPAVLAAVTAATATVLAVNGKKWANRINEATLQFNGRNIGYQARLEVANMRRDIAMANNPIMASSARTRMAAADFRKNSGMSGTGVMANTIGAAYDGAVGAASNAIFGLPGLVQNIMQWTQTAGGIK